MKESATCAFSPAFVDRFLASTATSASVDWNVEVSSVSASVPRETVVFATVTDHGLSGAAALDGVASFVTRHRAGSALEQGLRKLQRAVAQAPDVDCGPIDGNRCDAHVAIEDADPIQRDRDPVGRGKRRAVPARELEPIDAGVAAHFELALLGLAVDEHELEPRRELPVRKIDARPGRQIRDVRLERQRVEVDVDRRFAPLREGRGRPAQQEVRAVESALDSRGHANVDLVRQRRQERHADGEVLDPVLAARRPVVECERASVDLDVVERKPGRRAFGRGERLGDQVMNAVASVAVAGERHRRMHELQRVEHRRAMP